MKLILRRVFISALRQYNKLFKNYVINPFKIINQENYFLKGKIYF